MRINDFITLKFLFSGLYSLVLVFESIVAKMTLDFQVEIRKVERLHLLGLVECLEEEKIVYRFMILCHNFCLGFLAIICIREEEFL